MQRKVIVTGPGRSGTTFLMIIFTYLHLDTGFTPENIEDNILNRRCNSGLERRNVTDKPYIIKNPQFTGDFGQVLKHVIPDYVIIPLRNYKDAADSRYKNNLRWRSDNPKQQEQWYHEIVANYVFMMTTRDIPTIFLDFERMIKSKQYLFDKLQPILKDISFSDFEEAYDKATEHQTRKRP